MSAAIANTRLLNIAPSGIRAIHDRKRPTSLNLGIGEPSLKPDVAPFESAVEWVREHGCPYTSYAGIPELRELVASFYGGTGLLIVISVALDLVQKINSHLVMRNYPGLTDD